MAAATLVMQGEEDSYLPVTFVPTMKFWAWVALGLRHIPDFLYAIQLLNGALARLREDIHEFDLAFGSVLLDLSDAELQQLERMPDILEGLQLFPARIALLYTLGHVTILREEGSLPEDQTDDEVNRLLSRLAGQPVARQTHGPIILNGEGRQSLCAIILGMTVQITFEGTDKLTVVAETFLGTLEAFFATTFDYRVWPHTEKFQIKLVESADASEPTIATSALDMLATVTWPATFSPTNFQQQHEIRRFLAEIAGHVLGATCVVDDAAGLLDKLYEDGAVQQRMAMIAAAPTSYHRVASRNVSRLAVWEKII